MIESDTSPVGVRGWLVRLKENAQTAKNPDLEQRCDDAIVCLSNLENDRETLTRIVDKLRSTLAKIEL